MKLFVDTWGWLAQEDRKEPRHTAALGCFQQRCDVRGRIMTSDYVLDETFTLLFRRRPFREAWQFTQGILASAAERFLSVESVNPGRFRDALELRRRYADKPRISFTDLTTMVIMRGLGVRDILTADAHFQQIGLDFRVLPE